MISRRLRAQKMATVQRCRPSRPGSVLLALPVLLPHQTKAWRFERLQMSGMLMRTMMWRTSSKKLKLLLLQESMLSACSRMNAHRHLNQLRLFPLRRHLRSALGQRVLVSHLPGLQNFLRAHPTPRYRRGLPRQLSAAAATASCVQVQVVCACRRGNRRFHGRNMASRSQLYGTPLPAETRTK